MNRQKKAATKDSLIKTSTNVKPNNSSNEENRRPYNSNTTENKGPYKIELALFSILHNGPQGITQPEAFTSYRESCLHTTISSLKHEKGISFVSQPDFNTVAYFNQKPFSRYWLASDKDRVKAQKLLNAYRSNRGLSKVNFEAWHKPDNKAA
tara:strand:+ start:2742 stop:3197 length:456 start_codon:yes stop_codon:yes gene_type:complete